MGLPFFTKSQNPKAAIDLVTTGGGLERHPIAIMRVVVLKSGSRLTTPDFMGIMTITTAAAAATTTTL